MRWMAIPCKEIKNRHLDGKNGEISKNGNFKFGKK